jgi:NAD(P)-dependent dehydrogenase (short-subunit alcohol dehydrogenase family)
MDENTAARLLGRIALKKLGTAQDAAQALRFLLDPVASGYVTGSEIRVDGGLNISY